ncbi:precorrin-4 C11-methylase [Cenarchaeum symbiosum A]|uniref:Precorrin-4 C11-methylase n=1 Tax=Cenarchaeum symbiosum (strain A) TaxID=414004 RepID=A0RYV8_CENSY|nr:precorrin-4 C11-methylase [Cenarchaeum symbiosum A]
MHFVGCGPGDPELITIKARKLIRKADVLVHSGSLIPRPILEMCGGKMHDASGMIREEIFALLRDGALKGKHVVRLHDGDPSVYGAIREQIDALEEEGIGCTVVPGVTSMLAASAALGVQLTLPGVTQTIMITRAGARTGVPAREGMTSLARHGTTIVLYLSVHLLRDTVKKAVAGGYKKSTPAAVVYRASWPDQKIVRGTLGDIADKVREAGITRTAIVMIGDVISPKSYEYSRLYDKSFSHGYRKAKSAKSGPSRAKVRGKGPSKPKGSTGPGARGRGKAPSSAGARSAKRPRARTLVS